MVIGGFSVSGGGGVTDHGKLDGLADDDHSQYSLVDGTRAFTGTVGGVTPSASADLATKGYVDGVVVTDHGALSGLGDDDHPQYAEIANAETITGDWDISGGSLILPVAGSAPTGAEAKIYYDTGTNTLYYYDSSRSKWLSVEIFSFTALTRSAIGSFYLAHHDSGAAFGATRGVVAPRDGTLIGLFRSWTGNPTVEMRANGTIVGTALGGLSSYDMAQNGNFTAGQHLTIFANSASPGTNHWAGVVIRWRV